MLRGDDFYFTSLDVAEIHAREVDPIIVELVRDYKKVGAWFTILDSLQDAASKARRGEDCTNSIRLAEMYEKEAGIDISAVAGIIAELGTKNYLDSLLFEIQLKAERGGDTSNWKDWLSLSLPTRRQEYQ